MKGVISFVLLFAIIATFAIFGLAIMSAGQYKTPVDSFNNTAFGTHEVTVPAVNQSAIGAQLEGPFASFFGIFAIIAAVIMIVVAVLACTSGGKGR